MREVLVLLAALTIAVVPARARAQEAPPRLPSVELPAELDRVLRDYERAWEAGDAAALAALFTPDGFVSNQGGWIRGTEAIRREYVRAGGPLRLRALAHAVAGDTGWIVGAYGYGPTAGDVDNGKVRARAPARGGGPVADRGRSGQHEPAPAADSPLRAPRARRCSSCSRRGSAAAQNRYV